ncbi:MAG: hypothetical protein AAFQ36_06190 [Pseudomonadota bacterium]
MAAKKNNKTKPSAGPSPAAQEADAYLAAWLSGLSRMMVNGPEKVLPQMRDADAKGAGDE